MHQLFRKSLLQCNEMKLQVHWSIRGAILQWSLRVDFSHQSVQLRTNHFISYMRCMIFSGLTLASCWPPFFLLKVITVAKMKISSIFLNAKSMSIYPTVAAYIWEINIDEGIIAGGAAGVIAEAVLYPIDTIKTRLQASGLILSQFALAVHGGGKINFKGLYSGLAGNLAGVLPASAIFVGVYEPTKQKLLKSLPENLSALAQLTAGAIGGAASSLVRVPTEVVKQRMQTGQFASAPDAIRLIVSEEGFKGLYAGYGSFLLRDLPFDAIQFCIYEQMLMGYKLAAKRDPKDAEIAIVGAFAGNEAFSEA
ncbi:S-adenosylmethionine carrier 1 [Populus alba x Populus x berolinensis]|nr:S-adenosylmethionine carrier 1 [Populus alba x Populus x berolinensis]